MEDLAGKIAVVTGGAAGIGRGIVGALLDEGCRVVIADIEAPVLTETVAELSERHDQFERSASALERAVEIESDSDVRVALSVRLGDLLAQRHGAPHLAQRAL